MVISVRLSLNNMRTARRCIESNLFINFCGMLMKSELEIPTISKSTKY